MTIEQWQDKYATKTPDPEPDPRWEKFSTQELAMLKDGLGYVRNTVEMERAVKRMRAQISLEMANREPLPRYIPNLVFYDPNGGGNFHG